MLFILFFMRYHKKPFNNVPSQDGPWKDEDFGHEAIKFEKKYGKDVKFLWNGKPIKKKEEEE